MAGPTKTPHGLCGLVDGAVNVRCLDRLGRRRARRRRTASPHQNCAGGPCGIPSSGRWQRQACCAAAAATTVARARRGGCGWRAGRASDTASYDDSAGLGERCRWSSGFSGRWIGQATPSGGGHVRQHREPDGLALRRPLNGDDGDNLLEGGAGADTLDGNGGVEHRELWRARRAGWNGLAASRGSTGGGSGTTRGATVRADREPARLGLRRPALNGEQWRQRMRAARADDTLAAMAAADLFDVSPRASARTRCWISEAADLLDFKRACRRRRDQAI